MIGLCRNPGETAIFQHYVNILQSELSDWMWINPNEYAFEVKTTARQTDVVYPKQSPDLDEIIWQLPYIVDTGDVILYVDCRVFANISIPTVAAIVSQHHIVCGVPKYSKREFAESNIPHYGDYFLAFDRSEYTYEFFDLIREIGRNWSRVAVQCCVDKLRIKQLDTEIGIALKLLDPDRSTRFALAGFVDTPIDSFGQYTLKSGNIVHNPLVVLV